MNLYDPGLSTSFNPSIFSNKHIEHLVSLMSKAIFAKGSYLFGENDVINKVFYVIRGTIVLTKSTECGKRIILYTYHQGDLVGDIDLFDVFGKQYCSANVIEDAEIGIISKKNLEDMIYQNSEFCAEFIKWIHFQDTLAQLKIRDLVLYSKQAALCSTLIRMAYSYGVQQEAGILINKKITHTDLSDYIGTVRESVNRILTDLKKKGCISYSDGYFVIKDINYLKQICHWEHCPVKYFRI